MWGDDRYDRDPYNDDYRYRRDYDRDSGVLDDLAEMAVKAVLGVLALLAVLYGAAWGIDHLGIFDTKLTDELSTWVQSWFSSTDSTPVPDK